MARKKKKDERPKQGSKANILLSNRSLEMVEDRPKCVYLCSLNGHEKAVNAVRFSPDGRLLATGGDDGTLLIWARDTSSEKPPSTDEEAKEVWKIESRVGLPTDVFDISWSTLGTELVVASTDNRCTMYALSKTGITKTAELSSHSKYVQGVAWDPMNEYIASSSNDKSVRVYSLFQKNKSRKRNPKLEHVLKKPLVQENAKKEESKEQKKEDSIAESDGKGDEKEPVSKMARTDGFFHDDSVPTFFRRIAWSPDGNLLVCPTGKLKIEKAEENSEEKAINVTHVFTRASMPYPVLHLPSGKYCSVVARFSPVLYKVQNTTEDTVLFKLPYRMIFAVGTMDASVLFYDTQQCKPICAVDAIHYEPITDLTWSSDGKSLVAVSIDGYATLITLRDCKAFADTYSAEEQRAMLKMDEAPFLTPKQKKNASETEKPSPSKKTVVDFFSQTNQQPKKAEEVFVEEKVEPLSTTIKKKK